MTVIPYQTHHRVNPAQWDDYRIPGLSVLKNATAPDLISFNATFAVIDGSGISGVSSMLVYRLFRDYAHGSDSYEHDAAFLEFDIHYQTDGLGSDEELSKT